MASDGRELNSRSGHVDVPDEYLPELRTSAPVANGILSLGRSYSLGTRRGRRCRPCGRTWQAWTAECHKCHQPTEPE